MMKHWKRHKKVPIKSFLLELLVAEFFDNYPYKHQSYYYYDWFVRDFLAFLINRRNGSIYSPGGGRNEPLGNGWLSHAQRALAKAIEACTLEYEDYPTLAGIEWTEIFGGRIPTSI